jgi:hypothetical protein
MKYLVLLVCITLAFSFELKDLKVKTDQTSLSGLSSGAYFATQYEIAHSSSVLGSASIAGGPYGCNSKNKFTKKVHNSKSCAQ